MRKLGPYELVEKLGEGGMGEVWKARDTRLNRFAAIKILPAARLAGPEHRLRFIQEAQAASALNHPNIITIYGIDNDAGTDFIAMEYVKGAALDRLIPRKGLALANVLEYGIAIAGGLAAAHAAGIIHRDLKPGNIMVREDGQLKILDFGLAKLAEAPGNSDQQATETVGPKTESGTILGTISYMSPEQAEGRPVDARSDIFSFGAVLYEMVTGRRAFQGDSKLSTLSAILRDTPKPAGEVSEGVPREIERLIERCLRKDPARRFQSMLDLKVMLEDLKQDSESGALRAPAAQALPRRRPAWTYATAAVLLVLLVAGGWIFARRNKGTPEPEIRIIPLTYYPGIQNQPAFSADGRQVAYVWNGEKQDNLDIYVKMISTGSQLRLTSDPAPDYAPAWSPDGSYIAFARNYSNTRSAVLLISPLGGAERKVAEFAGTDGLDWSADGKWLAVGAKRQSREAYSLFLVSLDTGEIRQITTGQWRGDYYPAFSPDGRSLAFVRAVGDATSDPFVLELGGGMRVQGAPRRLNMAAAGYATQVAWTPDGRSIVFSRSWANAGLWRVPAAGAAKPERLPFGTDGSSPAVARHGNLMAYSVSSLDSNIWELPLASPDKAAGSPHLLISSTRLDQNPHISPDGRRICFESSRDGKAQLWVAHRDGSNQQPLVSVGPGITGSGAWSPDGSRLVFDGRPANHGAEIWTMGADGGVPQRLTNTKFDNMVPSWSRDGKWIYFVSNRTGRFEVWKTPSAGGEAVQVTRQGGWYALESTDGQTLYYQKDRNAPSLWKIPVAGGEEAEIPGIRVSERAWAPTDRGIYFIDPQPAATLKFYNFGTGQIRNLAEFNKPLFYGLAVATDGRSILYSQIDSRGSDIMLVENFR